MADTESNTKQVRISKIFCDFFESKKEVRGNITKQIEVALKGNESLMAEIKSFADSKGIEF